jgi:hypothetical protein
MLTELLLLPVLYLVVADVDRLIVETSPAVASVVPLDGNRKLLRLPDLEFPVRVVARCGSGRMPEGISISIADTRVSFDREALSDDAVLETSVHVSSRQVAPVAVDGFCSSAGRPSEPLLLPTALTAQFSLRCVSDDEQSIAFRARTLDVLVHCALEAQPD